MAEAKRTPIKRPANYQRYLILGGAALFGVILILFSEAFLVGSPFWRAAIEHLGTALFIASVLGLTIDWWLTKQITEDVFSAAMWYELPDDLKEEIRNVYGNKILCY